MLAVFAPWIWAQQLWTALAEPPKREDNVVPFRPRRQPRRRPVSH
jgi:hypothetical protein